MARKQVTQVQCSRCDRVDTKEAGTPDNQVPSSAAFSGGIPACNGEPALLVSFEDLCGPCARTVRALLQQIGKKIEGLSPDRHERKAKSAKTPKVKEEAVAAEHKKEETNGSPPSPSHHTHASAKPAHTPPRA